MTTNRLVNLTAPCTAIVSLTALHICIGVLAFLVSARASADIDWPPPATVQQRWSEAVDMVDRIQAMLPPSIDDVESLAERLDYDIESAIVHVGESVRFEPYVGVLRGPEGTAVSAAGSAWDQALLLAALVRAMGADSQVVVGTLSENDARRLLNQAFKPRVREAETFDTEAVAETVATFDPMLAESLKLRIAEWQSGSYLTSLDTRAVEIARSLQSLLAGTDVQPPSRDYTRELINSLSDNYAWVRWRGGPSSEWSDVHPAFADVDAPQVEAQRYIDGVVPPEYQHRVTLRMWIERKVEADSEPVRLPVMDAFERPTAELAKQPLLFGMAPLSGGENGSRSMLVPVLNYGLAPGAQAVSELGLTVSADVAGSTSAAFFENLSAKMVSGLGAVSEDETGQSSQPKLTGVVLTIEQSSPGDERLTVERRLVDFRDSAIAAFPQSATFELLFETDVGTQNQAQMTHRFLNQERALVQTIPAFYAFARGVLNEEELQATPQFQALDRSAWLDWDVLSEAFLPEPTVRDVAFRQGPMLSSRRRVPDAENGAISITDIHSNPVTVLHRHDSGEIMIEVAGAVKQGVRDSLLESHLFPVASTWSERTPQRLVIDVAELDKDVASSAWPRAAREMAINDLSAGYVLALVDQKEPHWWRVNPVSGETLGMGQFGGQTVAEFIVTSISIAVSVYIFKESVESCDEKYSNNRKMADCCIVGNLISTYGWGALGAAHSAAAGAARSDIFKVGFAEAPFAAATGYIITMLAFDVPAQLISDAVSQGPIGSACAEYLGQ